MGTKISLEARTFSEHSGLHQVKGKTANLQLKKGIVMAENSGFPAFLMPNNTPKWTKVILR